MLQQVTRLVTSTAVRGSVGIARLGPRTQGLLSSFYFHNGIVVVTFKRIVKTSRKSVHDVGYMPVTSLEPTVKCASSSMAPRCA